MCQQQTCTSNATYVQYMSISSCEHMRQLCQYIYHISTPHNQNVTANIGIHKISHYWHMPLDKFSCHVTQVCPTALIMWSTYRVHITAHTSQKQQTATFIYLCYIYICANNKYVHQIPNICHIDQLHDIQMLPYNCIEYYAITYNTS